jgi:hypothetical protein
MGRASLHCYTKGNRIIFKIFNFILCEAIFNSKGEGVFYAQQFSAKRFSSTTGLTPKVLGQKQRGSQRACSQDYPFASDSSLH